MVTLVGGAAEAIAKLAAAHLAGDPYALILTDMHMPEMDGFAMIEKIRALPGLSAATIMMITLAGHRGAAARCRVLKRPRLSLGTRCSMRVTPRVRCASSWPRTM